MHKIVIQEILSDVDLPLDSDASRVFSMAKGVMRSSHRWNLVDRVEADIRKEQAIDLLQVALFLHKDAP